MPSFGISFSLLSSQICGFSPLEGKPACAVRSLFQFQHALLNNALRPRLEWKSYSSMIAEAASNSSGRQPC
jgi:hypothetical protein